jgi:hypothetical protein
VSIINAAGRGQNQTSLVEQRSYFFNPWKHFIMLPILINEPGCSKTRDESNLVPIIAFELEEVNTLGFKRKKPDPKVHKIGENR